MLPCQAFSGVGSRLNAALLLSIATRLPLLTDCCLQIARLKLRELGIPHSLKSFNNLLESETGENMKCLITDIDQDKPCSWCNKKTCCLLTTIEDTFFKRSFLCWKCLQKSIELRKRQEQLSASKPDAQKST